MVGHLAVPVPASARFWPHTIFVSLLHTQLAALLVRLYYSKLLRADIFGRAQNFMWRQPFQCFFQPKADYLINRFFPETKSPRELPLTLLNRRAQG